MIAQHTIIVEKEDKGVRLDRYLSEQFEDLTRSYLSNLISDKLIRVNGEAKKSGYSIKEKDIIEITIPKPQELSTKPQDIPINIIYEDEHLAVVSKPKGMVVHPAIGSYDSTLVNALLYHLSSLSSINGMIRPGIVHRLDKNTSGLLVVAKDDKAHLNLSEQIANKSAKRIYKAIVDGNIKVDTGSIIAPIGRSKRDRKKMAVVENGRYAHTDYTVLERYGQNCLVEFSLYTGRTHQIRVHAKHIGHPITGDSVYGGDTRYNDTEQLLHAYRLEFVHPYTNELMSFNDEIPDEMSRIIEKLRG